MVMMVLMIILSLFFTFESGPVLTPRRTVCHFLAIFVSLSGPGDQGSCPTPKKMFPYVCWSLVCHAFVICVSWICHMFVGFLLFVWQLVLSWSFFLVCFFLRRVCLQNLRNWKPKPPKWHHRSPEHVATLYCKRHSYCRIICQTKNIKKPSNHSRSAGFSIRIRQWRRISELSAPSPADPARETPFLVVFFPSLDVAPTLPCWIGGSAYTLPCCIPRKSNIRPYSITN